MKPLFRRVLMFSPTQEKKIGKGVLWGNEKNLKHGEYTRCRPCWIFSWADDCKTLIQENLNKVGKLVLIPDSFCLIQNDINLWPEYEHRVEFAGLKDDCEKFSADVDTKMVHENSLIAEVLDGKW